MEETYRTTAIILKNESWRESDARIIAYSPSKGKLELMARGAKKNNSKLAGHLEPITLSELMIVRGKNYDYAGSAIARESHPSIKNNLTKLNLAGGILRLFDRLVKPEYPDLNLYNILESFLFELDRWPEEDSFVLENRGALWQAAFALQAMSLLGYHPTISDCQACHKDFIISEHNFFSLEKGGLVCEACRHRENQQLLLVVSKDCIFAVESIVSRGWQEIIKSLELNNSAANFLNFSRKYLQYNAGFD